MAEHVSGSSPAPDRGRATRQSLLERVRNRDELAWQNLVYIYTPLVHHLCHRWHVYGADAEDIVQEVLHAVALNLHQFQREQAGEVRTFRSWLGGIVRNKLTDFFRRQNRQPQARGGSVADQQLRDVAVPEVPDAEPGPEAVQGVCQRALELIRGDFTEQTWQAFWRTSVDGQSATTVAAELGMSAVAVRKAKSRVLHRLKQELGDLID